MAHTVPPKPPRPDRPGAAAQRELFLAWQEAVSDDFFVYSRLRYAEAGVAQEGEMDFLVLHREMGLLVIECKGRGVRRARSGGWERQLEGAGAGRVRRTLSQRRADPGEPGSGWRRRG